jgi:hypothetical protein
MKKLFYLLFLLPLALLASCDNHDDLAEVDFKITLSGVTQLDNTFYAVQGDEANIDAVTVTSLTDQAATVTGVRYFLDGAPLFGSLAAPFSCAIPTEVLSAKTHTISIAATVLQVDKSISNAALEFPIVIVEDAEDLPEGAPEIGTYTLTVRMQPDK